MFLCGIGPVTLAGLTGGQLWQDGNCGRTGDPGLEPARACVLTNRLGLPIGKSNQPAVEWETLGIKSQGGPWQWQPSKLPPAQEHQNNLPSVSSE